MGNYTVRQSGLLTSWQMTAAQMMFQGKSDEEISRFIFNTGDDDLKIKRGKNKLQRLRKTENFQEYYKSLITEWSVHNVGRALTKLSQQIDRDDQPWLANKAANDVLNQYKQMVAKVDDNTVVIRMEGAPALGTPDDEE